MEMQLSLPAAGAPVAAAVRHTLDSLAALDGAQLGALFASGTVSPLEALNGHPSGRMLAVPGLGLAPVAAFLRKVARHGLFPWEGKSFACASGTTTGRGINRVRLFGRRLRFPFQTRVGSSLVDGKPCVSIIYDVPEIPWFARATYDELRLVSDGLYLGRGMRKRSGRAPQLLVWFALDAAHPDAPMGTGPDREWR
jgi:hypothetical protein